MSEASQALQKIARGTGIVFAGTIISMLFGFLSRTIIARYFTTSEYGVFNLALTVLNIALVVVTLGFPNSLPREIAFYKEREPSRVRDLISTALIIVALNSLIWTIVLILEAENISQVFNEERLVYALKIVAFALPFSALTGMIISISRGFRRVREQVYFQNIVYPILWLILVLSLVIFNLPFASIFYVYLLAQSLKFFALFFEVYRIKLFELKFSFDLKLGKELIIFSLPLMFVGILNFLMTWTDTLMLGYYKSSKVVGLYNAASPLARLIPIFLNSAAFLYPPIVSQLYAQGKINEMKRTYQILTKWIFLLTLPIFSVMFLFPEATILFIFGEKYVSAAPALQILALGFMFHTFLGLNGLSLVIIKESNFILISNLISAILNVILNVVLIPIHGIEGAAIATAVSYFVANVLNSWRLYQKTRIHPFSWNYVKPLVISFSFLLFLQSLKLRITSIWYAMLILAVFLLVCFFLVLLSKSIDKEDIELFLAIEKKLGIEIRIIKKILRRFV
ncbi:flippase [Thermococcus sp. LS2]|uniref:flippase n=1 Tax=Thermococcus sp. LS2 TaxID=1638260 RepID=UPI001438D33F|nr:flippase [Thermococcus sp. LS2]NJE12845.1 flippase [Thermococcus sp. LS2]